MKLNLFTAHKSALSFTIDDWIYDEVKKNYTLKITVPQTKFSSRTKIYLYKQQGDRYIFMSDGYESVINQEITYYSQAPFSGKIKIK